MAKVPLSTQESAGTVARTGTLTDPQTLVSPVLVPESPGSRALVVGSEPAASEPSYQPPVRCREMVAVGLLVALADVVLYRGHGFAGYAALFVIGPMLLLLGAPRPRPEAALAVVGAMLLLLAAALVWCGSGLLMAAGFALLVAFAMSLSGLRPYVLDLLAYGCQTIVAGIAGLIHYCRSADQLAPIIPRSGWLKVVLPLAAIAGFGTLFVLANPDIATAVAENLDRFFRSVWDAVHRFVPSGWEVLLWVAVAWAAIGLLRPVMRESVLAGLARVAPEPAGTPAETPFYAPIRNMLIAVIVLFAAYLAFEFQTLWFREFEIGFYYAGYAHEGAAWLTVALALATVVLSAIFRGRLMRDARLPWLRRLAWIWSAENLLLALAVYHRLAIYIGFNGMTRMRTVGLFGITAVLVGFVLVVWKITHGHGFVWLVRRHLWTLAIAVYLFAITPVDALVHTYNVRRILAGDLAPAVQISVHPIDSGGALFLRPLVDCKDQIIRHGIRALLAERAQQAEMRGRLRQQQGWTSFQLADHLLLDQLHRVRADWAPYTDPSRRKAALDQFHSYAYQWY